MGGEKLSPRQKMISLMYLVFIAMLAMNVGKEVLNGFGLLNQKIVSTNTDYVGRNALALESLALKATESPDQFADLSEKSKKIHAYSEELFSFFQDIKEELEGTVKDKTDYQSMDKGDYLDEKLFLGSAFRKEFLDKIKDYKTKILDVIGDEYPSIAEKVLSDFDVDKQIKDREGFDTPFLEYYLIGFPLISQITKLTQLQNDIVTIESDLYSNMLSGQLAKIASFDNYTTLLELERSVIFSGETFTGSIVLGRKDATTKPNEVSLNIGTKPLSSSEYEILDGKVKLNVRMPIPGDYNINGKLVFRQDGKVIEVPVNSTFAVIERPSVAVISADKMNTVYRGVDNPISITIPGVPNNKVKAEAPGLTRENNSYILRPGKGREVIIKASGELDGKMITSERMFRIKDIPRPIGTISGQSDDVKLPKNNIKMSTIGAKLEDFDFDLKLKVTSFKLSVPSLPSATVNGNRFDSRAEKLIKRARKGDIVQVFDIKANIIGNSGYKLKKITPLAIEIQ